MKKLNFLILVLLVIGIFFRFVNLDQKVGWGDETNTLINISGYTKTEFSEELFNRPIVSIKEIHKFQRTNEERGLVDTIRVLPKNSWPHTPLYFVMARFWGQWFGNSIAVIRSLSALFGVLALPCLYWLCLELFKSPKVGMVAVGLMSVSPVYVLYSQEARPYALWTITILLSSAALLRAVRVKTIPGWGLYAITLALGLYTFAFTILVAVGHGIYILVTNRCRITKVVIAYLSASLLGFIVFLPWILLVIHSSYLLKNASIFSGRISLSSLILNWFENLSYSFADFWHIFTYYPDSALNLGFGKYIIPLILSLMVYSFYFLISHSPNITWLFIITLTGLPAITLMLPDLIGGGYRSLMVRYFMPCYIGIHLTVAYLLATKIYSSAIEVKNKSHQIWKGIMVALIFVGIISIAVSSQAEYWWNKGRITPTAHDHLLMSRIINEADRPLLILQKEFANTASLSHMLDSETKIQFIDQKQIEIPDVFGRIFTIAPSPEFKEQLEEHNYKIERIYKGLSRSLWELKEK